MSVENVTIYNPIDARDDNFEALVAGIEKRGIIENLVVTRDGYIISGNRRFQVAEQLGLKTVPITVMDFRYVDDEDRFIQLLREFNRHRDKTFDEKLRETVLDHQWDDDTNRWWKLVRARARRARTSDGGDEFEVIKGDEIVTERAVVADERRPLLKATTKLIFSLAKYWPLSRRQVYYRLLDVKGLMRNTKLRLPFGSNDNSYDAACRIINDGMRLEYIPRESITDDTRPLVTWNIWQNTRGFLDEELGGFLTGYARDLLQSQPNHFEIIGEKSTIKGIIQRVAVKYTMPFTIGRGYCAIDALRAIAQRFADSGKENLILLALADHDPDGMCIVESAGKTMLEHAEDLIEPEQLKISVSP